MESSLAIVSVVTSGCIALAALALPLLLGVLVDSLKWSRERRTADVGRLDRATVDLLETLSSFRSRNGVYNNQPPAAEDYSRLLARYYAWERAVWPHCRDVERAQVKQLRSTFEAASWQHLHDDGANLSDEILTLAHATGEKLA